MTSGIDSEEQKLNNQIFQRALRTGNLDKVKDNILSFTSKNYSAKTNQDLNSSEVLLTGSKNIHKLIKKAQEM